MMQLMEAHQPQASPTSRAALSALPRRKVRSTDMPSDVFSNTPSDQPAACAPGEPCSVCHDRMEENSEVLELPCQHCYHEDCITSWLKDVGSQACAVSGCLNRISLCDIRPFQLLLQSLA